ncbi:hypothetical protein Pcac1_g19602 [Phytophthora cactorum]|nr:hypothetical protein Pcac1_g19602 [Phytophthora cactorum]
MRSLVTAVSIGHLPSRRRQKSQRGKHCRRRRGGRRKELVTEISTSEYRHLARMNDYRFYHENSKKREPWYAGVIRVMPSFKTSSYDVYLQRLQFFWKHLRFLLAVYAGPRQDESVGYAGSTTGAQGQQTGMHRLRRLES